MQFFVNTNFTKVQLFSIFSVSSYPAHKVLKKTCKKSNTFRMGNIYFKKHNV